MTQDLIQNITSSRTLPKDELDNFWDNFFGFLPVTTISIGAIFSFFAKQTPESVTIESKIIFLFISLTLLFYTIWTKLTERKIKSIQTNLNRQQNLAILEKLANENSWSIKSNKSYYKEYLIPFILGHHGHKLTVIILDDKILYNLRNLGSSKGRMPYLFGIDTIKENSIRRKIKNYA